MTELPTLPFAVYDEFGRGADDRVQDYGRACWQAALASRDAEDRAVERDIGGLLNTITELDQKIVAQEAEIAQLREDARTLRKIAAFVPARIYIGAKEQAGYGTKILADNGGAIDQEQGS